MLQRYLIMAIMVLGLAVMAGCTQSPTGEVVEVAKQPQVLAATTPNMVSNPDFAQGGYFWNFYSDGAGFMETPAADDGSSYAKVTIQEGAKNIQLYQSGILVDAHSKYRLEFMAYSPTGSSVAVLLHDHVTPFTNYGLSKEFQLSGKWEKYYLVFDTNELEGYSSVHNARLRFWFAPYAQAGDTYFLKDISLTKVQ